MTDPSSLRLDGRVVVLTGASSGIGLRFARVLHGAGAHVIVAARRTDRLRALADELDGVLPVACDVSVDADCRRLVDATMEAHGRVDVLVNNAGTTVIGPALDETPEQFRQVVDVNLTGTFTLCREVAGHMIAAGGGSIVNVASILGIVGVGQIPQAAYAASKGGVINLTRELAAQWARRGVRVNALAPGWFPSEMTADMWSDERSLQWIDRKVPMGRGGHEHELDGALLFLAGDASTYVTGQVLAVDGGYTAI